MREKIIWVLVILALLISVIPIVVGLRCRYRSDRQKAMTEFNNFVPDPNGPCKIQILSRDGNDAYTWDTCQASDEQDHGTSEGVGVEKKTHEKHFIIARPIASTAVTLPSEPK